MPALLELASEVNGFVTFRQVMAPGSPGATIRSPARPRYELRPKTWTA